MVIRIIFTLIFVVLISSFSLSQEEASNTENYANTRREIYANTSRAISELSSFSEDILFKGKVGEIVIDIGTDEGSRLATQFLLNAYRKRFTDAYITGAISDLKEQILRIVNDCGDQAFIESYILPEDTKAYFAVTHVAIWRFLEMELGQFRGVALLYLSDLIMEYERVKNEVAEIKKEEK